MGNIIGDNLIDVEGLMEIKNMIDSLLDNPCLPFMILDIADNSKNEFYKLIGVNGKGEIISRQLKEYIERYRYLKACYLLEDYSSLKEFLANKENLNNVLNYFISLLSNNLQSNVFVILFYINQYLNHQALEGGI